METEKIDNIVNQALFASGKAKQQDKAKEKTLAEVSKTRAKSTKASA